MARRPVEADPDETTVTTPATHVDLAQAIVELGKAAESRRHARHELVESSIVLAVSIRKQLRTGDEVQVPIDPLDATPRKPAGLVLYSVQRFPNPGSHPVAILCRDDEMLEPAPPNPEWPMHGWRSLDEHGDLQDDEWYPATAEERLHFAREAGDVVAAFAELLRHQTDGLSDATQRLTKLVVR